MSIVLCKDCYTTYYESTQHIPFQDAPAYVYHRLCTICQRMHDTKQFDVQIDNAIPAHICYGVDTNPDRMRLDYVGWDNARGVKGFMCRGCGKAYWCKIDNIPRDPGALKEVAKEDEKLFAELFGKHRANGALLEQELSKINKQRMGGDSAMLIVRYNDQTGQMETHDDGLTPPPIVSHTFSTVPPDVPIQEAIAAPTNAHPTPAEVEQEQPLPIKEDITPEMLHAARQVLQQVLVLSKGIEEATTTRQQMRDAIAIMTCPYSVRDLLTRGDGPQDTVVVVSVNGGETDAEYYQVHGRVYTLKTKRLGKKVFRVYTQKYQWQMLPEKYEGKLEAVE